MQFEEFDSKVREAAENHHPAYDEKAWAKMQKLLDLHLPQKKDDRRRILFFLLLFLLLGGGAWIIISKPWKENKQITAFNPADQKSADVKSQPVVEKEANSNGISSVLNNEKSGNDVSPDENVITTNPSPLQVINSRGTKTKKINTAVIAGNNRITKVNQPVPDFEVQLQHAGKKINNKEKPGNLQADAEKITPSAIAAVDEKKKKNNETAVNEDEKINIKPEADKPQSNAGANNDNPTTAINSPEKKTKNKNKKGNTFFFTLSAGPDISNVSNDKLGKTKLLSGAGLGFTFKDRLTLRTGFYTGRKVYTSSPESYHPPASFWNYYRYLQKVDADCKVYEIPLSLSYNFSHSSKQQLFASAGISSLLMKSEDYNYFYKYTATGPTVTRKYSIQDQNKHYFSILTLSGGYQRNFGKYISITAEPYIKLPLSGVGFGKVKLNSGGILFSVGIKPFAGSGNKK